MRRICALGQEAEKKASSATDSKMKIKEGLAHRLTVLANGCYSKSLTKHLQLMSWDKEGLRPEVKSES